MVTKKPKGLGRGLEALLGPTAVAEGNHTSGREGTPRVLPLDAMVPGVYQPRTRMDEGALYELAESIKAQGIMQPILVRKLTSGEHALQRAVERRIVQLGGQRLGAGGSDTFLATSRKYRFRYELRLPHRHPFAGTVCGIADGRGLHCDHDDCEQPAIHSAKFRQCHAFRIFEKSQ